MALTGVLARRIAAFKNAEAPSISRLGYLHPPLTPRPRSDVIPVTGSEKVTAIKVMVMSFTFCIMPAKSSSSPTREQRTERLISGPDVNFTGRRIASSSAFSVLLASEPPVRALSAVIGQSPNPAVSTRCCNSAPRQGAMGDPCLPCCLPLSALRILCIMVRRERLL
ncbi:hypothetical protein F4824DRAFT_486391 [Ustulina deusta]|nr:hypothetical protein F4824DRAFT_486391 [Ustulina deusta]